MGEGDLGIIRGGGVGDLGIIRGGCGGTWV